MAIKFATIEQPSIFDGWKYIVVEGKEVQALTGLWSTSIRYNATQDCEDFYLDLDEDWGVFEGNWNVIVWKGNFAMRRTLRALQHPREEKELVSKWNTTKQKKVVFEGDNVDIKKVASPKKKTPRNLITQAIKTLYSNM